MFTSVAAWFAGKTVQIIAAVLAVLALIAIPWVVIDEVRLNGVSIMGWHLVDGAIHARELAIEDRDKALADLKTSRANQATLEEAIRKQNLEIARLGRETKATQERAAAAIAAVVAKRDALAAKLRRIDGAKIDTSSAAAAALSIERLNREGVQ